MPPASISVYTPESESYGARLRRSHEQFIRHEGNVTLLRGDTEEERQALEEGVKECLEAAQDELSTIQQEELLSCARFGKCFLDGVIEGEEAKEEEKSIAEQFQLTARSLRVLNALRDPKVLDACIRDE